MTREGKEKYQRLLEIVCKAIPDQPWDMNEGIVQELIGMAQGKVDVLTETLSKSLRLGKEEVHSALGLCRDLTELAPPRPAEQHSSIVTISLDTTEPLAPINFQREIPEDKQELQDD